GARGRGRACPGPGGNGRGEPGDRPTGVGASGAPGRGGGQGGEVDAAAARGRTGLRGPQPGRGRLRPVAPRRPRFLMLPAPTGHRAAPESPRSTRATRSSWRVPYPVAARTPRSGGRLSWEFGCPPSDGHRAVPYGSGDGAVRPRSGRAGRCGGGVLTVPRPDGT